MPLSTAVEIRLEFMSAILPLTLTCTLEIGSLLMPVIVLPKRSPRSR